jgi:hypothetical protein
METIVQSEKYNSSLELYGRSRVNRTRIQGGHRSACNFGRSRAITPVSWHPLNCRFSVEVSPQSEDYAKASSIPGHVLNVKYTIQQSRQPGQPGIHKQQWKTKLISPLSFY